MDFRQCMAQKDSILMEGALGERLKREYGVAFDEHVAMARLIYDKSRRESHESGILIFLRYVFPDRERVFTRLAVYDPVPSQNHEDSFSGSCRTLRSFPILLQLRIILPEHSCPGQDMCRC